MAKIQDPVLFSTYFGISSTALKSAGLINPFLDVDTRLFIDPLLLEHSGHSIISRDAAQSFRSHFSNYIRLLAISQRPGDAAWKGARKLLDLTEPPENGLGYGGSGRSGSSRPDRIRETILQTSKEIVDLGARDPDMIALMGFFEPNVGADTISDFTTRVIINELAGLTHSFCLENGISVSEPEGLPGLHLPSFQNKNGKECSIVLLPVDIVRDLPIANDWSDIESSAMINAVLRDDVNSRLASITKPTIEERKKAIKDMALSSAANFEELISTLRQNVRSYNVEDDELAIYAAQHILTDDNSPYSTQFGIDITSGPSELMEFVRQTVEQFKHHVENGNLWEELWNGSTPKKERAAQLIFFAIADCFCRANNVDISPEANMGGGPIDFKFSIGYNARVLVEMKRSNGRVVHGYERQLEIYRDASRTNMGIYVVMDYGDLGTKLSKIQMLRQERLTSGESASEIIVIDATKKASASKRD